jgi:AraC-like DNA-binding protein
MGPHDEICAAESWDALEALVKREPLSVVVLNPAADGVMDAAHACKIIRRYSSIPFVAYVPLDAPFARVLAHMANEGLQDVLVVRSTDSPAKIRESLERVSLVRELTELVAALEPWLQKLPHSITNVLVAALHRPHQFARAEDIAESAGITVSALYRGFRRAGLASPKHFVVGARAFRGYLYLSDSGFSIRDVSTKLGYTHPRIFAHQFESVFQMRPSALRRLSDPRESLRQIMNWLCRGEVSIAS